MKVVLIELFRRFCKRKKKSVTTMGECIVLSKKDIEDLLAGQSLCIEVDKYVTDIKIYEEEKYNKVISEVRRNEIC